MAYFRVSFYFIHVTVSTTKVISLNINVKKKQRQQKRKGNKTHEMSTYAAVQRFKLNCTF